MARVQLQAHKGVESEYPGNTMVSFRAAAEQGYEWIELDLRETRDGRIAVLHDKKINSTARNADGSRIENDIFLSDITYEEALKYDFGIAAGEKFRGEKIPLFSDVLAFAAENRIALKVDNKLFELSAEARREVYRLARESGAKVCISCITREHALEVKELLPGGDVSFDGITDPVLLSEMRSLFGRERLTVWFPTDRNMAGWAPGEWFITPEKRKAILPFARLGVWAIESVDSFHRVCRLYHPDAAETTGIIKPSDVEDYNE